MIYKILDRNHRGELTAKQFQDLFDSISRQNRAQVSTWFSILNCKNIQYFVKNILVSFQISHGLAFPITEHRHKVIQLVSTIIFLSASTFKSLFEPLSSPVAKARSSQWF